MRNEEEIWYLDKGNGQTAYAKGVSISEAFTKILKENGLYRPDIKPLHGWRSMVISRLIKTYGLAYARLIAGHNLISTTEEYEDIEILDLHEAVNVLRIPSKFTVKEITE